MTDDARTEAGQIVGLVEHERLYGHPKDDGPTGNRLVAALAAAIDVDEAIEDGELDELNVHPLICTFRDALSALREHPR